MNQLSELNFYYCDHNDIIAERIGDVLEEMGIFEFTPLRKLKMNLFGMPHQRVQEINSWYEKNARKGGKVNIVVFLTKFIKDSHVFDHDMKLIRQMSRKRNVNLYTVVDDAFRSDISNNDEFFSWLYKRSVIYDVTNTCIIADTVDVARSLTMELVKQRFKNDIKRDLPVNELAPGLTGLQNKNIYINSIAHAYEKISDMDCPGKFLLIFSLFKYVEQTIGTSPYSKCMEYLLKRSTKEFLMTKKDLELSHACLMSDMFKIKDL